MAVVAERPSRAAPASARSTPPRRFPLRRWLRWLPSLLMLAPLLLGPAAVGPEARIRALAGPHSFRLVDWESVQLVGHLPRLWEELRGSGGVQPSDAEAAAAYFQRPRAAPPALRAAAESAIERAVAQAYREAGAAATGPVLEGHLFPPVLVALTAAPSVLIISPRGELRVVQSALLSGSLGAQARDALEQSADSTGVSSLVTPVGGLATYPAMVLEGSSPATVLNSAAHEWVHHYLIFYPLGSGYWASQETREINETTADLVAAEIGRRALDALGLATQAPQPAEPEGRDGRGFDFRAFMRATRQEVERLLAAGEIEPAEAFMRDRRDELAAHGYEIRRLNQAYLAFHGSYGEGFAASPRSPVPGLLRQLRGQSQGVGDFLRRVRGVSTVADLRAVVGGNG